MGAKNMIIAGECIDWRDAIEIEDIVKTSTISSRMRKLSHFKKNDVGIQKSR